MPRSRFGRVSLKVWVNFVIAILICRITPIDVRRIPSSRPSPRLGGEKETESRFDCLTLGLSRPRFGLPPLRPNQLMV